MAFEMILHKRASVLGSSGLCSNPFQSQYACAPPRRTSRLITKAQNQQPVMDQQQRAPPPPPPPPSPPPPPPPQAKTGWPKPNRRDLIAAGVGSLIGGAAMYIYDTLVIDALYDDLDDLEDELELAAEEAYLTEAALEEADGAGGDAGSGQTMADLEKSK